MVLVVGAGIVGVSQALALARRGFKVVLIDSVGIGQVTSWGNSGFLCPSLVQPVTLDKILQSDWKYRFPFPTDFTDTSSSWLPVRWFGRFLLEQQKYQDNSKPIDGSMKTTDIMSKKAELAVTIIIPSGFSILYAVSIINFISFGQ